MRPCAASVTHKPARPSWSFPRRPALVRCPKRGKQPSPAPDDDRPGPPKPAKPPRYTAPRSRFRRGAQAPAIPLTEPLRRTLATFAASRTRRPLANRSLIGYGSLRRPQLPGQQGVSVPKQHWELVLGKQYKSGAELRESPAKGEGSVTTSSWVRDSGAVLRRPPAPSFRRRLGAVGSCDQSFAVGRRQWLSPPACQSRRPHLPTGPRGSPWLAGPHGRRGRPPVQRGLSRHRGRGRSRRNGDGSSPWRVAPAGRRPPAPPRHYFAASAHGRGPRDRHRRPVSPPFVLEPNSRVAGLTRGGKAPVQLEREKDRARLSRSPREPADDPPPPRSGLGPAPPPHPTAPAGVPQDSRA